MLKYVFILLFIPFFATIADDKPVAVGKVVKVKHELEGTNYFITYKKAGQYYAYPISPESKIRNLDKYIGKTVQISGKTDFRKSQRDESKFIMYFEITKMSPVSLSDVGVNAIAFDNDLEKFKQARKARTTSNKNGAEIKVSDKAANTAILVGGAALAAEVLGAFLK